MAEGWPHVLGRAAMMRGGSGEEAQCRRRVLLLVKATFWVGRAVRFDACWASDAGLLSVGCNAHPVRVWFCQSHVCRLAW
jgi:hypothetical protein